MKQPPYLSMKQAKILLGVSLKTIWRLEKKGELKPEVLNGHKFYSTKEVIKVAKERRAQ